MPAKRLGLPFSLSSRLPSRTALRSVKCNKKSDDGLALRMVGVSQPDAGKVLMTVVVDDQQRLR